MGTGMDKGQWVKGKESALLYFCSLGSGGFAAAE
jgi:hypothetical protein